MRPPGCDPSRCVGNRHVVCRLRSLSSSRQRFVCISGSLVVSAPAPIRTIKFDQGEEVFFEIFLSIPCCRPALSVSRGARVRLTSASKRVLLGEPHPLRN